MVISVITPEQAEILDANTAVSLYSLYGFLTVYREHELEKIKLKNA